MEKARIINGENWGGNHSQNWLDNNQDKVIAGQLVSEWTLIDVLPNPLFKKPEWTGSEWIETYVEIIVVPQELHRMKIFLELADRDITIDNLKAIVNGTPSEMLTDIQKAKIIVKIDTAQTFRIDDENLVLLAPIVGINNLPEFFISANNQQ